MKPITVELTPAQGLDLQNDAEKCRGALVSMNVRRDAGTIKCCQPTVSLATDGTDTLIGVHFHWQQDASIMRVAASTKLYLDGVAALVVAGATGAGTDFAF